MSMERKLCPDCDSPDLSIKTDRRKFLMAAGAAAVAVGSTPLWATAADTATKAEPESIVKTLYESLSEDQKKQICFAWDYMDPKRGLLRTRISNNWQITEPTINTKYYTADQKDMIRTIFDGIIHPDWHKRIEQQLTDDAGGYGEDQAIAIFGTPGTDKFEFVMTGRHMTIRCDGNSAEHVAFGGPIFYGHAAHGFNEDADHPGNVFWPQAQAANALYKMMDGKQQQLALVKAGMPKEQNSGFRAKDQFQGIPVTELSADQKEHLQKVLADLIGHYRQSDQDEALACIKTQGGLDACNLAFYAQDDIGNDGVWDNWRLEGPSLVWHFRGAPHVHVWVNVADDPGIKLNA